MFNDAKMLASLFLWKRQMMLRHVYLIFAAVSACVCPAVLSCFAPSELCLIHAVNQRATDMQIPVCNSQRARLGERHVDSCVFV